MFPEIFLWCLFLTTNSISILILSRLSDCAILWQVTCDAQNLHHSLNYFFVKLVRSLYYYAKLLDDVIYHHMLAYMRPTAGHKSHLSIVSMRELGPLFLRGPSADKSSTHTVELLHTLLLFTAILVANFKYSIFF